MARTTITVVNHCQRSDLTSWASATLFIDRTPRIELGSVKFRVPILSHCSGDGFEIIRDEIWHVIS